MKAKKKLNQKRIRRVARVRAVVSGTASRPRLTVRRSNRYFYAQLIDDVKGVTLLSASSFSINAPTGGGAAAKMTKTASAGMVGELIGKKAAEKGIKSAVFDRRSYKFHGRVKSFVEGAKKGGLTI
ncbi:MAG TPA: 50S ribosomal protein L18 [Candidatus Paceibacterota bacterium]|nr:50S ribosomal protein L18 [Candidatus Paceibacterota bacterium]